MASLVLKSGTPGVPVTLHLTSEPVTFPGPGVAVEVPDGYVAVLTNPALTAPHAIDLAAPTPAPAAEEPLAPARRSRRADPQPEEA
jgi:hypothetical protein